MGRPTVGFVLGGSSDILLSEVKGEWQVEKTGSTGPLVRNKLLRHAWAKVWVGNGWKEKGSALLHSVVSECPCLFPYSVRKICTSAFNSSLDYSHVLATMIVFFNDPQWMSLARLPLLSCCAYSSYISINDSATWFLVIWLSSIA